MHWGTIDAQPLLTLRCCGEPKNLPMRARDKEAAHPFFFSYQPEWAVLSLFGKSTHPQQSFGTGRVVGGAESQNELLWQRRVAVKDDMHATSPGVWSHLLNGKGRRRSRACYKGVEGERDRKESPCRIRDDAGDADDPRLMSSAVWRRGRGRKGRRAAWEHTLSLSLCCLGNTGIQKSMAHFPEFEKVEFVNIGIPESLFNNSLIKESIFCTAEVHFIS
ncbi:hypothetical protein CEXT_654071 [Caerostris extrusa]|uniref:Uncharacterized protein n=1 Tax=Caerostris extrusa TaxID=172846 RepID=A0AAV4RXK7_CAEEX|nr:hypothetical protein CEXT_654071 [Caerostris extrusa]